MAARRQYVLDNQRVILQGSSSLVSSLFKTKPSDFQSRKRKSSDAAIWDEFQPKKSRSQKLTLWSQDETLLRREDPAEGFTSSITHSFDCEPIAHKTTKRKLSDVESGSEIEPKKSHPEKPPKTDSEHENALKKKRERRERRRLKKALRRVAKDTDATDFELKYEQHEELGEGGFGSVFAGVRISDQQPVAIKHIKRENAQFSIFLLKNYEAKIPTEVVLMTKAAPDHRSVGLNPSVSLLNWYNLDEEQEVVLVMERPTPSQDLFDYCAKNAPLPEDQAKVLMKQVVDALADLHSKGVFHRDIKLENLLVQDTESGPRIRIIDFGCGCHVQSEPYYTYKGTREVAPPEAFLSNGYHAGPASVWQSGALLYELLRSDDDLQFSTKNFMEGKLSELSGLSQECRDFLQACLALDPNQRISLDQLSHHPWFNVV